MMGWQECGQYLGRIVRVAVLDSLEEFKEIPFLASSTLLLCIEDDEIPGDVFRDFLEKLVPLKPLAIVVAGSGAPKYFDDVQSFLDEKKVDIQIMTGVNDSVDPDDWQTEFLQATWPSEDRHDVWNGYAVMVIGSRKHQESVCAAFRGATD